MENPIKIAMKMEIDGMAFYKEAARETKNPLGSKMFLSFVEDERKHLKTLEMLFKGVAFDLIDEAFKGDGPRKRIQTVFSRAKEEMEQGEVKSEAEAGEVKALQIAMDMEKEGYDYYVDIADNSDNDEIKKLFRMLAEEEDQHYKMLQNTHTYLTDTGNWYLWDEMGVIDGG